MKSPKLSTYIFLTPVHALLLACIALPSIYVVWLSLNRSSYGTELKFVGLANYVKVFRSVFLARGAQYLPRRQRRGLRGADPRPALAVLFASGIPFRGIIFACILMPYAVSEVVGVLVWKMLMIPMSE